MTREFLLIIATSAFAYLIMLKADQQMLTLLKGRLHKLNLDSRLAEGIWKRNLAMMPRALFPVGGALGGLGIVAFGMSHWLALPFSLLGVLCFGLGAWSRIKSFNAADQEIKTELLPGH